MKGSERLNNGSCLGQLWQGDEVGTTIKVTKYIYEEEVIVFFLNDENKEINFNNKRKEKEITIKFRRIFL